MSRSTDRRRRAVLGCAAAAVALTLSACGSSGAGSQSSPPESPSSQAPTTSGDSPTTSAPASSSSASAGTLASLLISASDVGTGFSATSSSDSGNSPFPCTPKVTPFEDTYPPDNKAEADFANATTKVEVSQVIESYDDAATTAKLISATETGLACKSGTISSTPVTIYPIKTGTVAGLDVLKRWDIAIPSQKALATVVLVGKGSVAELVGFFAPQTQANTLDIGGANEAAIKKLLAGA